MERWLLALLLLVFLLPLPFAILLGNFIDYTTPSNRWALRFHPGYYYLASQNAISVDAEGRTAFRGGGPGFGK